MDIQTILLITAIALLVPLIGCMMFFYDKGVRVFLMLEVVVFATFGIINLAREDIASRGMKARYQKEQTEIQKEMDRLNTQYRSLIKDSINNCH